MNATILSWTAVVGLLLVTNRHGVAQMLPPGGVALVGQVEWAEPGSTGTMLFQGYALDGVLKGHLFAGDQRLVVTGTITEAGEITGSATSDGTAVGTFTGNKQGETLIGTYLATGSAPPEAPDDNLWVADGSELPLPE